MGLHRILFDCASGGTFRRRVPHALENARKDCPLSAQFCWRTVLPDPAPPLRCAPRCDLPVVCPGFGLDRFPDHCVCLLQLGLPLLDNLFNRKVPIAIYLGQFYISMLVRSRSIFLLVANKTKLDCHLPCGIVGSIVSQSRSKAEYEFVATWNDREWENGLHATRWGFHVQGTARGCCSWKRTVPFCSRTCLA